MRDGRRVEPRYLTAIVMGTGFLAARDLSVVRWAHSVTSSTAYACVRLASKVLPAGAEASPWPHRYIYFGWTVFPAVFLLTPTGLGLLGAGIANLLYLVLDIKIVNI